jgi:hypothetical protein
MLFAPMFPHSIGFTPWQVAERREKDPKFLSVAISESYAAATFRDDEFIAETVPADCKHTPSPDSRFEATRW